MKWIILSLVIALTACTKYRTKQSDPKTGLSGAYVSCFPDNGTDSQKVTITLTGNQLFETIENFIGVTDCSGTSAGGFDFSAEVAFEAEGASAYEVGATNVILTPSVDLFGCGAGVPAYTYMKLDSDYNGFQAANGQPVCDPATLAGAGYGITFTRP